MLYNLRGPNGSGKSHVVHEILAHHGNTHNYITDPLTEEVCATNVADLNLWCIGMYAPELFNTGGCDWFLAGNGGSKKRVDDLEYLLERLVKGIPSKNILYEGFMVSGTYGRWGDFALRMKAEESVDTTFLCLDTPVEVCYDRIVSRRAKVGNHKPFNGDNLKALHRQCWNNYKHLERMGCNVVMVPHETAPEFVHGVLRNAAKS